MAKKKEKEKVDFNAKFTREGGYNVLVDEQKVTVGIFKFPFKGDLLQCYNQWYDAAQNGNTEKYEKQAKEAIVNHYEFYSILDNDEYVTRDSILSCIYGTNKRKLDLLLDHGVKAPTGQPLVSCNDCKANDNIHAFGVCSCPKSATLPERERIALIFDTGDDPKEQVIVTGPRCFPLLNDGWRQVYIRTMMYEKDGKKYEVVLNDKATLVCQYGGFITIDEVSQAVSEVTVNIAPWLIAFKGEPTREGGSKIADLKKAEREILRNANPNIDWYSYMAGVSSSLKEHYTGSGKNPVLDIAAQSQFVLVNDELRYWVGVGPEVLSPGYNTQYPGDKAVLDQSQFKFGTELDVVLQNMSDANDKVYVKCICGMIKGHSFPHGVFQTGDAYPYSVNISEDGSDHKDGSYVEFLRDSSAPDGEAYREKNGIMSKYIVIDIIIYERGW